ncbi:MAG: dephospho-CoA kinase [Rhodocyclaceae bacterium]|jgi:dephospho-CoA kinase|nr:dephospho-CoA kinase [Rhodocyclaceae bacterium]
MREAGQRPFVVGLTGGIGSGKSAAADRLADLGAGIVDADALAHALTGPGGAAMPAIRAAFGDEVVTPAGALDRAAMRALAFSDPAAKARLEGILHPMIRQASADALAACTAPYIVLVVPLLVESGDYRGRCDRVCVVDCPEALQVERVRLRSGLAEEQVKAIMAAQATRQARLAVADDVVDNSAGFPELLAQMDRLHRQYLALAEVHRPR